MKRFIRTARRFARRRRMGFIPQPVSGYSCWFATLYQRSKPGATAAPKRPGQRSAWLAEMVLRHWWMGALVNLVALIRSPWNARFYLRGMVRAFKRWLHPGSRF